MGSEAHPARMQELLPGSRAQIGLSVTSEIVEENGMIHAETSPKIRAEMVPTTTSHLKEEEVCQSPSEGVQLESSSSLKQSRQGSRVTDHSSKRLLKRVVSLMSKKKPAPEKLSPKLPSVSGGDLDLIFAQAEATLGELLIRAGASFAKENTTPPRTKRNGLSRIWRFGGRVFCGSASMGNVNDGEFSGMAPLEAQEEGYWEALANAMVNREDFPSVSEEDVAAMAAASSRESAISVDNYALAAAHHHPIEEGCGRQIIIPSAEEDPIAAWWPIARRDAAAAATGSSAFAHSRSRSFAGSTRLNTMLEESPTLLHNGRRAAGSSTSGTSSMPEAQPFERFLSLRRGAASTTAAVATRSSVGTPNRVSLMTLLQERDDSTAATTTTTTTTTESCPGPGVGNYEAEYDAEAGMDPFCCVCMVGRKGAALIPCGHTFCRRCTRELWRGRGACPLCNKLITQVLDIF